MVTILKTDFIALIIISLKSWGKNEYPLEGKAI